MHLFQDKTGKSAEKAKKGKLLLPITVVNNCIQESSKGKIEHKIDTLKEDMVEEMLQKLTGYDGMSNKVNRNKIVIFGLLGDW